MASPSMYLKPMLTVLGRTGSAAAVDHRVGDGGEDAVFQHVAQFGFAVDGGQVLLGQLGGFTQGDDAGDVVWVPARRPSLLVTSQQERTEAEAFAHVEGTDAFGSV